MKYINLIIIIAFLGFTSCEVDEVLNPNAPIVEGVENGATLADLRLLASGLEATIRNDVHFHFWTTNMVGREYYDLRGTDPRYTSELIGKAGANLDNNGFLTTRSYFGRYKSVRNAHNLMTAVSNTAATLSSEEENAFRGFANTIIGYELLLESGRQYENGLRTNVADPDNLGAFNPDYASTLSAIKEFLETGYTQLSAAGTDFPWAIGSELLSTIPGGDVESMAKMNRAITARLELYAGNMSGAIDALNNSFVDLGGSMEMGAYYTFGVGGNDLPNNMFYVPNSDIYVAHPSFITDAEAGDLRLSKVRMFDDPDLILPVTLDDLSGSYQVSSVASNSAPFPIVKNEELLLIWAEAKAKTGDMAAAVAALDAVRNAAGLSLYEGGMTEDDIMDDVVYQRRYGLFGEGHRWIDLRRLGRLGDLPLDRDGDVVHTQFPTPAAEAE